MGTLCTDPKFVKEEDSILREQIKDFITNIGSVAEIGFVVFLNHHC